MKLFQVLIVVSVAYVATAGEMSEAEMKMVKGQLESCKKSESATEEQLDNLLSAKDVESRTSKCLIACAMEKFTVVDKEGDSIKINPDNVVTLAKMKIQDEAQLEKVKQVSETCNTKVTTPERCDYAFDLVKCLKEEADKVGLKE